MDEADEAVARPKLSLSERLKRTPPVVVFLTVAAVGSSGFFLYQLSTRTAPIQVLTTVSVITGLVYLTIAAICSVGTYQAAVDGLARRSYLLAFVGGIAAIVAAGCLALALVLFLALGF